MTNHFQVDAIDGSARVGTLHTAHGPVETPAFMPVATLGSVKALAPDDLSSPGRGTSSCPTPTTSCSGPASS